MHSSTIASGLLALLMLGLATVRGRIIERCELARELRQRGLPADQIATFVCIAEHQSSLNTAAIGPPNSDGSKDHGLFQINDRWCCTQPQEDIEVEDTYRSDRKRDGVKGCGVPCARLRTDDILESVTCARKVFAETQFRQGNGFNAWSTYKFCKYPPSVAQC